MDGGDFRAVRPRPAAVVCRRHPGFAEDLGVAIGDPLVFAQSHPGLVEWGKALRSGAIRVEGRRDLARALSRWNASPRAQLQMRKGLHYSPHAGFPPGSGRSATVTLGVRRQNITNF
jgi:hypothetical protein